MLLIHGTIYPASREKIEDGYILIQNGKIVDIGHFSECQYSEIETVDMRKRAIYPGFIDAHSHIGMWEDSLDFEGDDGNEETDPIMPQLSALDAVNPYERSFSEALAAGITTVATGPGSANPIGGRWIAIKTYGNRIDDMLVTGELGVKFALGENPKQCYHEKGQTPVTRMGIAALIREQLEKTRRYAAQLLAVEQEEDRPEYDAKCEALLPLLSGKERAFFHCHRRDDIFTAIRIAKEFSLNAVLVHATEGHLTAPILKEEGYPIIAGPIICDRSKPELHGHQLYNAAVLCEQKIPIAICTDHPVIPVQYLPLSCGLAIRAGLSREDALLSITFNAAKILGIDNRVGSIEKGKDADLVVFQAQDDIFSVYSQPMQVMINGEFVWERGRNNERNFS